MIYLIRVDKNGTPKTHKLVPSIEGHVTEPKGNKDYWVEATLIDPPYDPKTQIKKGPVYDVAAKTITYTVLPKAPLTTDDEIYDKVMSDKSWVPRVFKAYVLAVNDGSVVPGMTKAQIKAAVKDHM